MLPTSQKANITMTSISNFDSQVYSEELLSVSETEYNEVMQMMAEESDGFQGYSEWSQEVEQGQRVATAHGEILINKECSHIACRTTRCERDVRIGGIAI
jgi:hypothetical protein